MVRGPERRALVQAMAAGVPVVASDIPATRELAADAALYVPTGDERGWAEAIEALSSDPGLRARLPRLSLPTLVIWGNSDRISTPAYGKQFASLIPSARFELLTEAGHFPQIERLDKVMELLQTFTKT